MSNRVCAVVVTYNRKNLLRECLLALQAQTRAVDTIVVVNNASTDGTQEMLKEEFPQCQTLDLPTNGGGAGGFHEGMKWAYEQGFDWIWLMDDDGRPAPDCLEKLLEHGHPNAVLVPLQQDSDGRLYGFFEWRGRNVDVTTEVVAQKRAVKGEFPFAFVGPLIAREIVKQVGLPNKDFFIWFDDWEYALRIKDRTNAEVFAVPDAVFFHDFGGKSKEVRFLGRRTIRSDQAAWKTYYGTRNQLYTFTRTRHDPRELFYYFLYELRTMVGDVLYEPDRWQRVRLRLMGMRDGAVGRLGKRV
jgi:GT2 family glycosyltransferase